jgi:SAM-dependent methyltransferase
VVFDDHARAESFGSVAELYDRVRPSYPSELIDALLVEGPRSAVDVGCGTGIAAALLIARGCRVVGVEVDERMAELARAKGIEVEVASFELWETARRMFDLVTAARSWHWVEPKAGAAKAAAVLNPGGRICAFWNIGVPPTDVREWMTPIYQRLEPGISDGSVVLGTTAPHAQVALHMAALATSTEFEPMSNAVFPWTMTYSAATWIDELNTHSDHQTLPPERRERLLAAVSEAIDAIGGSFDMHYDAVLISANRT